MKERPILFSGPMVRALLTGRKTQTRRPVKITHRTPGLAACLQPTVGAPRPRVAAELCPYGQPGDWLWVRETFFAFGRWETRFSGKKGRDEWHFVDMTQETGRDYCFEANGPAPAALISRRSAGVTPTWWRRPAIFMPRAASRILLEITEVRVERLQDISEADCIAEGCTQNHNGYFKGGPHPVHGLKQMATARQAYRDLWNSINGPGSWDANPWVWAVSFQRLT